MDIDGDGHLDILSGSYSRQDADMAGLFQVLYGTEDGGFRKAQVLNGTDGEPLIVAADRQNVVDKICTRPAAVDLDGDGHLDIVTGNFRGTFFMFRGTGPGAFSADATRLMAGGKPLAVKAHSDPFFVDWDDDGDLDLLSGSGKGGVFLAMNEGSRTEPSFGALTELIAPPKIPGQTKKQDDYEYFVADIRMGDDYLDGPLESTRVWAADVNADGTLDILVGDQLTLYYPAEGVDDAAALAAQEEFTRKQQEHYETYPHDGDEKAMTEWDAGMEKLTEARDRIVRVERTGFVWAYHGR